MIELLAIDPGSEQSAFVELQGGEPINFGKVANADLLGWLRTWHIGHLAIETMKPRGMPTAFEEMQTQLWAGRFIEAADAPFTQIFRSDEKMHLCGQTKAKDGNIRQALIDRWGGQDKAIGGNKCKLCKGTGNMGNKRQPFQCTKCGGCGFYPHKGPLYGFAGDCWQALAVAVTYYDQHASHKETA